MQIYSYIYIYIYKKNYIVIHKKINHLLMFTHRNISQTTIVIHVQSINNNYVNIFVYVTL